jgi:hypothetical protein
VEKLGEPDVVYLGSDSLSRKYVARVRVPIDGKVVFVKFALDRAGREDLRHELQVLSAVPVSARPAIIASESEERFDAIALGDVRGHQLGLDPLPQPLGQMYLATLQRAGGICPAGRHPLLGDLSHHDTRLDPAIGLLADTDLTVAPNHGDLAPWNVFGSREGNTLRCIDWEFGNVEGCPELDIPGWALQVSVIAFRESPARALKRVLDWSYPILGERFGRPGLLALTLFSVTERLRRERVAPGVGKEAVYRWRLCLKDICLREIAKITGKPL